jgi:hypothetical protein
MPVQWHPTLSVSRRRKKKWSTRFMAAITEEPYLVDTQPQRLKLVAVLLPRLGGVVGHKHQPLCLQNRKDQTASANHHEEVLSCELICRSIAFGGGPSIGGGPASPARCRSACLQSPFQITPTRHENENPSNLSKDSQAQPPDAADRCRTQLPSHWKMKVFDRVDERVGRPPELRPPRPSRTPGRAAAFNTFIGGWSGGPDGYWWVGTHAVGDKRIIFLAETLSKLQFVWLFHLFGQLIRWRVGPMWGVRRTQIGWEKFSIVFAPYSIDYCRLFYTINIE